MKKHRAPLKPFLTLFQRIRSSLDAHLQPCPGFIHYEGVKGVTGGFYSIPACGQHIGAPHEGKATYLSCAMSQKRCDRCLGFKACRQGPTALKAAESLIGHLLFTDLQAACTSFPEHLKHLATGQVQKFLRSHGIKVTADAVANRNVNRAEDFKNGVIITVKQRDEHVAARVALYDGTNCQIRSFVTEVDTQPSHIVTRVFAA